MQIAVILHNVASHLFLLHSAPVRIEPLVILDVVTCEDARHGDVHSSPVFEYRDVFIP